MAATGSSRTQWRLGQAQTSQAWGRAGQGRADLKQASNAIASEKRNTDIATAMLDREEHNRGKNSMQLKTLCKMWMHHEVSTGTFLPLCPCAGSHCHV